MKKLTTMLCAVFTLMLVSISTIAKADSSNFSGPYIGISASGYGIQLSGKSNAGVGQSTEEVSLGQVAPITGMEIGYAIPIGSAFLIDIGASMFQGAAKLEFHGDDDNEAETDSETTNFNSTTADVSFKIDDLVNYYIAPTLVLSDTSSLYLKVGLTEADVTVTGDITSPSNLSGTTWAMGTRTVLASGIFIKTEAGFTDYNGISAAGKGTSVSSKNTYSADPTVAFGTVALGFRF